MSSSVPLPLSSPAVPYQTHEVFNQSPPLHNYNFTPPIKPFKNILP